MAENKRQGNHLMGQSSPYLLQHAYNPVEWYPWGEEALEKAKKENKMLIISIGYAACHWCHVMEHESFEDDSVAAIMNEHFINIKVDREERPDIDDVYMTACHLASGGSCGWPLNAFALPDGRPVWAGTYFPKDRWVKILEQFNDLFTNDLARLERSAEGITQGIAAYGGVEVNTTDEQITDGMVSDVTQAFLENIDLVDGGTQGAPKFPMPNNYEYLLHAYALTENQQVLDAVEVTLDKMAAGGIYDHLGGGFARYSVDPYWKVPHFEKMLYDNGQLLSLYSDAYRLTAKERYLDVAVETADFMIREMKDPSGGYYSSYDADSEGEEGTFYIWSNSELDEILGSDAQIFKDFFSCSDSGNWEGKNILYHTEEASTFADANNIQLDELKNTLETSKDKLFNVRALREKPGLDDKVLTSWNGLAMSGLISVYKATLDQKYLDAAIETAEFISNKMIDGDHRISRNYKNGVVSINGFLDDYANAIQAYIQLYEQTFNVKWLDTAKKLMFYAVDHFSNDDNNMFYYTSDIDPPLVARKTDYTDNVIPGSNSVMAHNLLKLGSLYGNNTWVKRSEMMLNNLLPVIVAARQPGFYSNWCRLMLLVKEAPFEVAIMGAGASQLKLDMDQSFIPHAYYMGGTSEHLPLLENKLQDEDMIYVCKNKVCKFPVKTAEAAIEQIKNY